MPSPTQIEGARCEDLAEAELIRRGYRVVERNWRGAHGEIDRIAWDGDVLAFVEIRSRTGDSGGTPLETVGRRKQKRVVFAALAYLARLPPGRCPATRFDVVAVIDRGGGCAPEIELIKGAFDTASSLGRVCFSI